jgi:hypothetical protein
MFCPLYVLTPFVGDTHKLAEIIPAPSNVVTKKPKIFFLCTLRFFFFLRVRVEFKLRGPGPEP